MINQGSLAGVPCLVLGAGGFLGSNLCRSLIKVGARVHGFGHRSSFADALPPMRFTAGEFSDPAALALAVEGVDILFYLLGNTPFDVSEKDPIGDLQTSIVLSVQLLELCRAAAVRKIVFISSGGTVYGVPGAIPIREDAATDPISAYGINMLTVEKYLNLYASLGGASAVTLRVANPYGPFQSPFRRQGLVAATIEKVLTGRPVEVWGDGQAIRDYLHVGDFVEAALAAAVYDGPETVMNVGSGVGRSILSVVETVCLALDRPKTAIIHKPARRFDVQANVLDITRIRETLGWAPKMDWLTGLRNTAAWIASTFPPSGSS